MIGKIYELTVGGIGGAIARAAFPEFEVVDHQSTTVIRGAVPDQTALEETIARAVSLGFEVLEVRNLGDPNAGNDRRASPGTDPTGSGPDDEMEGE